MGIIRKIFDKMRTRTIIKPIYVIKDSSELLSGKTSIVTGGSSGIGLAIAQHLVEAGSNVYIVGRNEVKLNEVSKQIGCSYLKFDVNNIKEMETVMEEFAADHTIDILVNSAGTHGNDAFGYVTEKTFDEVISANVKALYFISQKVANIMIANGTQGHILNVSSASSLKPSWTPYEISKRAVDGITQGMAHKLIQHGIVVNGIAPGPTATPMMEKLMNGGIQWNGNPSGRMSTPEEIASLALFMVSSRGDGIVGDTFFITGGSGTICIDR